MDRSIITNIRKAQHAARTGNLDECRDYCLKAWAQDRMSSDVLVAVCTTLIDAAQDQTVFEVLGDAARLQGETEAICSLMGEMALRMNMPHVAEKAYAKACQHNPAKASYFLHLAKAYELLERQDEAIELLQSSLHMFPDYAPLWGALGMLVNQYTRDLKNSRIFLQEAIRLAPDVASHHHNLALTFHSNPAAEEHYLEALRLAPRNAQVRLSYALYLLARSRVEDAWPYYEARLDPELGDKRAARYDHGIPAWKGQKLEGKSILVYAEQGIGDEVFFSFFLRRLLDMGAKLHIGCDPRLVALYERSFPGCRAYGFEDSKSYRYRLRRFPELAEWLRDRRNRINYSVAIGSIPFQLGLTLADIKSTPGEIFLPDAGIRETFAHRIKTGTRPKIAVSWRSSNISGVRKFFYLGVDYVKALCETIDADFYVLQYSFTDEERAALDGYENLHFFDGVDLKQDIEANIAILSLMDVSVGPPTATQMFGVATGTPIFLVNNGTPWTTFGEQLTSPMFKAGSKFINTREGLHFKTNEQLVTEVREGLSCLQPSR